jgi:hypothetical protein
VCNCKLVLKKGDLLSHLFSLPVSKSQQDGTFLGHHLSLGGRALAMMAATRARVTSSQSSAISAASRAKRYAKNHRKEDVREPRKDQRNSGKNLFPILGLT